MNRDAALVRCRHLLGRLESHDIEASRVTAVPQPACAGSEGALPVEAVSIAPEAILASADGRVWLVGLWPGRSLQASLGLEGIDEAPALQEFATTLVRWRREQRPSDVASAPALAILAPALADAETPDGWTVEGERLPILPASACRKPAGLAAALLASIAPVLSAAELARWRAATVPEVRIDPPRRRRVVRESDDLAAPLLLDYRQERCARLDLEPDAEGRAAARDLRLRLVTGVAGCGKTLVLVHRAALLASRFPNSRVLLVSHNRPLIADLRRRLERLDAGSRIHCRTFCQWLSSVARPAGEMMQPAELRRWIERERQRVPLPGLERFSHDWLAAELGWMCDHQLADETYLDTPRKGREIPLSKNQRRQVLGLLQRYLAYLDGHGRDDWSAWPLAVLERRAWAVEREAYDHILVDEAQFFAPVWIQLLRRALKPGGHFFLCADPTQGFLRRRLTWSDLGLEARSRSVRLERPYRSTRAILRFARDFYQRRLPDEDEPLNLPDPAWLDVLDPGQTPLLRRAGKPQDRLARVCDELEAWHLAGKPLEDVLLLVAGRGSAERSAVAYLQARLGAGSAALVKDDAPAEGSVGVAHLMASTGLERPVVLILGLDELAAEESNPRLAEEERREKVRDHTRQIYVGLTRAMERLVVYCDHPAMRQALGDGQTAEPLPAATEA